MKKIILTLSGVLFVIVTGCSLLICMMNGIPNLDQPAAAFYLAKAILLSFSLPLVTLGLFVHCLQLRRKLDKKNLLFRNAMKELIKNRQTSCRDSGDSDFQSFKNYLPVCSVPLPKIPISAKKIRRTCWILLTNFK